ncbi:MAG: lysostaphin resistance A-like protein [Isosphaeraceae bacterium]
MSANGLDLVAFSIVSALLLAAVVGIFWSWGWALRRLHSGLPLVSDEDLGTLPARPAPWGGLTVTAIAFLYLGVNLVVHQFYVESAGQASAPAAASKLKKAPAPDAAKRAENSTVEKEQPAKQPKDAAAGTPQSPTDLMLQLAVVNLLLLVLVPVQLRLSTGATLADLGLHARRWRRQMIVGVRYAMLMTPVVYGVQSVAVRIWRRQEHVVEQMILDKFTFAAAVLAVLSTMVLAPLAEELLFRCIIQRWLSRLFGGSGKGKPQTLPKDDFEWELDMLPVAQPLDSTFPLSKESFRVPGVPIASNLAIFLTSFAFAAMHCPQWPAPIAIFFLSMALGTVYQRTGSMIATVAMHGTFNGISTLLLLLAAIALKIHPQVQPPHAFTASITLVIQVVRYVLAMIG